jgi:uncharacterized protein YndB with AHSA1/START domain
MPVSDVRKDYEEPALTVVADLAAPPSAVWQLWADPLLLERWWGTPRGPATVTAHDLTPGGMIRYFMTDGEGRRYHGWWRVVSAQPPVSLVLLDGFADQDGEPIDEMPVTTIEVRLTGHGDGTRLHLHVSFASTREMQQLLGMRLAEGLVDAMAQMDGVVRCDPSLATRP